MSLPFKFLHLPKPFPTRLKIKQKVNATVFTPFPYPPGLALAKVESRPISKHLAGRRDLIQLSMLFRKKFPGRTLSPQLSFRRSVEILLFIANKSKHLDDKITIY